MYGNRKNPFHTQNDKVSNLCHFLREIGTAFEGGSYFLFTTLWVQFIPVFYFCKVGGKSFYLVHYS